MPLLQIYLKLLLTAFFWGGTFIAGRRLAADVEPFSAAFLRFSIATIVLLAVTRHKEGRLPRLTRKQFVPVFLLGVTGVFFYNYLFFKGLHLIEAGRAAAIISMNPIAIILISALLLNEKLQMRQIIGISISVVGALCVISKGNIYGLMNGQIGWGEVTILGCVASWAAYSLIGKGVMVYLSPLAAVSYSSFAGAVCLFPAACYEGMIFKIHYYSFTDWLCISYLGFLGTAVGFVWFYQGIKSIGPTRASQFINFVPISAICLAYIFLNESITPSLFIGTIAVICGVYVTNTAKMPG